MASTNPKITGVLSSFDLNVKDAAFGATGDGVTDDTSAIQAALNAAASGQKVSVPEGTYIVTRVNPGSTDYCLNITSPLHLYLEAGATIKLADGDITEVTGDDCRVIDIDSSDVYIDGFGTVDMNRTGQTDTGIGDGIARRVPIDLQGGYSNVQIKDIAVTGASGDGIYLSGSASFDTRASNLIVQGIRMTDCREGILLHWADNVKFLNNNLVMFSDASAQDGIETSGCNEVIINNNYVEGAQGSAFDIYEQGKHVTLVGNISKGCGNGISIGYNQAQTTGTHITTSNSAGLITTGLIASAHIGELIRNTTDGSEGIVTANTTTTVTATLLGGTDNDWDIDDAYEINAICDEVTITGNAIHDCTSANNAGIFIYSPDSLSRTVIMGNTIKNCTGTLQHGILVNAGYNITIANNIIRDITSSNARGIRLIAAVHDCIVSGNSIVNTASHGIDILGCNDIMVTGNVLKGEALSDTGTNTIITNNNIASLTGTSAGGREDHANYIGGTWTA